MGDITRIVCGLTERKLIMEKHTPGPWTWHDRASEAYYSREDEGLIRSGDIDVCDFGNNETYYNTAGTGPKPADIALICAAPDLLESLQWALRELNGQNRYDEDVAEQQENNCYAMAEAAIAKATNPPPATSA